MITADAKERILRSGSAIIHLKGYNGTGIKEITDAAGIPKGSFYNYFKSKEHFAIEALDFIGKENFSRINSVLSDKNLPPFERLKRLFAEMIKPYIEKNNFNQGCFIGNMCQEMADVNTAISDKVDYIFRSYIAAIALCLRQAQEDGDIRADRDADKLAEFIFNSWEGALLRMKASRNPQPLNAFMEVLTEVLLI